VVVGSLCCVAAVVGIERWPYPPSLVAFFVCMLTMSLPAPLIFAQLHTTHVSVFYLLNPLVMLFAQLWLGSAARNLIARTRTRTRRHRQVAAITGFLRTGMMSSLVR